MNEKRSLDLMSSLTYLNFFRSHDEFWSFFSDFICLKFYDNYKNKFDEPLIESRIDSEFLMFLFEISKFA